MITFLKEILWKNFGAAIDMLGNAIAAWPDENWNKDTRFFYMAYHTVVFLDYYTTIPPKNYSSPLPYTLTEPEDIPKDAIDDVVPNKIYTKKELLDYLQFSREKCRKLIAGLSQETLMEPWLDDSDELDLTLAGRDTFKYTVLEILFYNLRHVQHHAAQLNLLLRQTTNSAPPYVSQAANKLEK